jgi:hypothetical protein
MKRLMIITACLLIGAGAASADTACMSSTAPGSPGSISAYGDAQGTSCYAFDGGGLVTVFLWHTNTDGATASQFLLDVAAAGWTWLGDNWNFTTVIGGTDVHTNRDRSRPGDVDRRDRSRRLRRDQVLPDRRHDVRQPGYHVYV